MLLSPKNIVEQLDKYIIGQIEAKKAIAIAFRNRYRRLMIKDKELQDDITPKNVLLIGSTGVGKTEIVRRAAKICDAPFIKVEATKFTEIGYVGKDAESIIRDLVDKAINEIKSIEKKAVQSKARDKAEAEILRKLYAKFQATGDKAEKESIKKDFKSGGLDKEKVKIEIKEDIGNGLGFQEIDIPSSMGNAAQVGIISISDILKGSNATFQEVEKTTIEAIEILTEEYANDMIDEKAIIAKAIKTVQENGVVFIDEFDKIISSKDSNGGRGEVSREGVQRDLLPIIEGTSVSTKYGQIDTRHILFIACGAFYENKPEDLLPEIQGRFPVQAKLKRLTQDDFYKIITNTQNNLILQYTKMLEVDNVKIKFTDSAIKAISEVAFNANQKYEDTGARRLHSVLEMSLQDLLFENPSISEDTKTKKQSITLDDAAIYKNVPELLKDRNEAEKFIL